MDSLEIAAVKFLNSVAERRGESQRVAAAGRGAVGAGRSTHARASRMRSGRHLGRPAAQPRAAPRQEDINIVPMLDVMVILAFFLIFTAVFSRTSILE